MDIFICAIFKNKTIRMKNQTLELAYQRELLIFENVKKASKFFKTPTLQKPISPKERAAKSEREEAAKLVDLATDMKIQKAIRIGEYLERNQIKYRNDYAAGKIFVKGYFSYEVLTGIFRYNTSAKVERYYSLETIFLIIDNIKNGGTGGKNKQSFRNKISDEMRFFQFNDFFKNNQERYELEENGFEISNYCLTAYLEDSGFWKVDFYGQFKTYYMNNEDLIIALDKNLPE